MGTADDAHVGDELDLEADPAGFPHLPGLAEQGLLIHGRHEAGVASASAAALRHEGLLAVFDKVELQLFHAVRRNAGSDSPDGHGNADVIPTPAVLVGPCARQAGASTEAALHTEPAKGVLGRCRYEEHRAPAAAVAAVRATSRDVLLPAEAQEAISPITGLGVDLPGINHRSSGIL